MNGVKFYFECDEEKITLKDSVELFALGICEDIKDGGKRTRDIMVKCKILDSLSNALNAINT